MCRYYTLAPYDGKPAPTLFAAYVVLLGIAPANFAEGVLHSWNGIRKIQNAISHSWRGIRKIQNAVCLKIGVIFIVGIGNLCRSPPISQL